LRITKQTYHQRTLEELANVPVTPRGNRGNRWKGIQHAELVQCIVKAIKDLFDFRPMNERYCVSPNGAVLIGGFELGKESITSELGRGRESIRKTLEPVLMCTDPQQVGAALGFKHSNDSKSALTIAGGGSVFLCENGVVSGEDKFTRKHTTGLRLMDWILEGLKKFWDKLTSSWKDVENLKTQMVTPHDHDSMLLGLGRRRVLPWRLLGDADRLWNEARYEGRIGWLPEGTPAQNWGFTGSLWDWYNVVTHIIKRLSPSVQFRALKTAMSICQQCLTSSVTVSLPSK
jgi:hypothetical protein